MNWEKALIPLSATIADAMASISASALQTAIIIGHDNTLLGILTDGDIRRAILNGAGLNESVSRYMCSKPHIIYRCTSDKDAHELMNRYSIHILPIVDSSGRLVGVKSYDSSYLKGKLFDNLVVIMAGGKGSRLGSLTKNTPKPMLRLHNKPILEIILERFIAQGYTRFIFAVNYLAEQIVDYFKDGASYGVNISYLHEKVRSGTAGALSMVPPTDLPILVSNADLLTNTNFGELLNFHVNSKSALTIATRQEQYTIPFGVIESMNGQVVGIKEKPSVHFTVNAGIYVLNPSILSLVPSNSFYDMTDLIEAAINSHYSVHNYNVDDYWLDIGCPPHFEQALKDFNS